MTRITHFSREGENNYKKIAFHSPFVNFHFSFPQGSPNFSKFLEFRVFEIYTLVSTVENVIPRVENRFGIFHFRPLFPQSNLQFCWQTS